MTSRPITVHKYVPILSVLVLIFFVQTAFAQVPDSIIHRYDSLAKIKMSHFDSTGNRFNSKVDTVQQRINNILNPNFSKFTSKLHRKRNLTPSDTLLATQELDSLKLGISNKIDSLNRLNLPTDQYTRKLDSLNNISPQKYIDMANSKVQSVENKINDPLKKAGDKVNNKLDVLRNEGGADANIPGNLNTDLPLDKVNLPNTNLNPNLNTDINLNNPGINNQINGQMPQIPKAGDITNNLGDARDKLSVVNQTTDKLQGYSGEAKNIAKGNLGDTKNIEGTIENKASQLDEVKDLGKQTAQIGEAQGILDKAKDADGMKEVAQQQIQKQAMNHFKGKEDILQSAMDKVSKIKEKYPDATTINDLKRRPPNPLKGRPFIDRIVPGVTLQIMKSNQFMIDINPNVSYRFNPRINAGLGWNERISFAKWNKLSGNDRVFGPRVFGSFGFKKGFSAKAELEKMNALVPSSPTSSDGNREWLWSFFVGLKKDYHFIGKVRGNVQVLYNLYDDHYNSPYFDRINVRMGFEFPMKKAKKLQKQAEK